ncbi:intraflagellar transport protein 22 homolog [Cimex lectularius]|uniref:Uncharacterized protein n=1 Tax=Cimex lectularius TaxID=79782 RepID=A0A8I6TD67_CIMLE|nr:intraflagellar transport protein 22 homolog [Cimex lectularius]
MVKLKIVVIGPKMSGKSTVSNFLSDAIDYNIEDYRPTQGVRILEFEIPQRKIEIELWDCSGDDKYENVWPVFLWEVNGVVLVFNPEEASQLPELDRFYENFVKKTILPHNNALVIANCKDTTMKPQTPELSGSLANITYVNVNVLENGEAMRTAFEQFASSIVIDTKEFGNEDISLLALPI